MVNRKIISAVIILSAGLVAAYLIIAPSGKGDNQISAGVSTARADKLADIKNPIQWIESGLLVNNVRQANFTKNLTQSIVEQVSSGKIFSPDGKPETQTQEAVENFLTKSKGAVNLISEISDSEIIISGDNSKEAKQKYLKSLQELYDKNFSGFEKSSLEIMVDVYQNLDVSSAQKAADVYAKSTKSHLVLAAPSDWKNFHKKLVLYFRNGAIIYSAMAEYKNDPIKGYVALELLEKEIINKSMGIYQEMEEMFKIYGA